jgi:hypothetical protein
MEIVVIWSLRKKFVMKGEGREVLTDVGVCCLRKGHLMGPRSDELAHMQVKRGIFTGQEQVFRIGSCLVSALPKISNISRRMTFGPILLSLSLLPSHSAFSSTEQDISPIENQAESVAYRS